MKIGMLWFDNSHLPLATKIRGAVKYYQDKYGTTPTLIMVHPKDFVECPEFNVQSSKSVLPNHLWLGMDKEE